MTLRRSPPASDQPPRARAERHRLTVVGGLDAMASVAYDPEVSVAAGVAALITAIIYLGSILAVIVIGLLLLLAVMLLGGLTWFVAPR